MKVLLIWLLLSCIFAVTWAIIRAFCKAIERQERIEKGD